MLPPTNMPDPSKQGVKKLHPTDATQNLGLFLANQEDHHLSIVDYKEVLGYQNEALGFGVRTEVARKAGDMMGLIVFGSFITEEKFVETAKAKGESTDFPRNPGAFALQTPYEKVICIVADNCPARYVNDAKGVRGAKANVQFLQHPDPRELFFEPMLGLHLMLQVQALCDIEAGEQLFTDYGEKFWENGAPINRKEVNEAELVDIGNAPEAITVGDEKDSDDENVFARVKSRVETPQSQKPKNAPTLSQDMLPVTPLKTFAEATEILESWDPKTPKPSSSKKDNKKAKVTKSGGGKDIDLGELPQASSPPIKSKQSRRAPSPVIEDEDSSDHGDANWTPSSKRDSKKKSKKSKKHTSSKRHKSSTNKKNWEEAKGSATNTLADEKAQLRAAEEKSAAKAKTATPKKSGYDLLSL